MSVMQLQTPSYQDDNECYTPRRTHKRTLTPALAASSALAHLLPAESLVANGDLLPAIGEHEEPRAELALEAAAHSAWPEPAGKGGFKAPAALSLTATSATASSTLDTAVPASPAGTAPAAAAEVPPSSPGSPGKHKRTATTAWDVAPAHSLLLPAESLVANGNLLAAIDEAEADANDASVPAPQSTGVTAQPQPEPSHDATAPPLPAEESTTHPSGSAARAAHPPPASSAASAGKHKRTATPAWDVAPAHGLLLPAESFVANGELLDVIEEAEDNDWLLVVEEATSEAQPSQQLASTSMPATDAANDASTAGVQPSSGQGQADPQRSISGHAAVAAWAAAVDPAAELPAEPSYSSDDSFELEMGPAPSAAGKQPPVPKPEALRQSRQHPTVLHSDAAPLAANTTEPTSQGLHAAPVAVMVQGEGAEPAREPIPANTAAAEPEDDEFNYSAPGSKRTVPFAQPVFKPQAIPQHLITDVSNAQLESFAEADEEAEGEEEAAESSSGADAAAAFDAALQAAAHEQQPEGTRQEDAQQLEKQIHSGHAAQPTSAVPATTLAAPAATSMPKPHASDAKQAQHTPSEATTAASPAGSAAAGDAPSTGTLQAGRPEAAGQVLQPSHLSSAISIMPREPEFELDMGDDLVLPDDVAASLAAAAPAEPARLAPPIPQTHALPVQPSKQAKLNEWEVANQRQQQRAGASTDLIAAPLMLYNDAVVHFLGPSTAQGAAGDAASASSAVHWSWLQRLFWACLGDPELQERCEVERVRLLLVARTAFDNADQAHLGLLQLIYYGFTGTAGPVARFGPHWEALGFQGRDPATDLRSCGMLALLHLAALRQHSPPAAAAIYRLAHEPLHEFPLAIISINVTKWAIQLLRENKLGRLASAQQSLTQVTELFYLGTLYELVRLWRTRKCTMAQSGFLLKDMERRAKADPKAMVRAADPAGLQDVTNGGAEAQ